MPSTYRHKHERFKRTNRPNLVTRQVTAQFIRINGTVVGAGVGLALHAIALALA
jgi:uncharacterized membrane-anchored protein YjiN (DUF445 family)